MPTFSYPTPTYADNTILYEAQLDDEVRVPTEDFFNVTKLDEDNIQDGSVTSSKVASAAISEAKIANASIDSDCIAKSASFNTLRAVTSDHIRDNSITSAKIADGTISQDKLKTANIVTATVGDINHSASTTVTAATLTLPRTPTNPVLITLTGTDLYKPVARAENNSGAATIRSYDSKVVIKRGVTTISSVDAGAIDGLISGFQPQTIPVYFQSVHFIDTSPATTYTIESVSITTGVTVGRSFIATAMEL
jgi:hypothetical protein